MGQGAKNLYDFESDDRRAGKLTRRQVFGG